MEQVNQKVGSKTDEISLIEVIQLVKTYWKYLLSKWIVISICGLIGGGLGLAASLMTKPKYTAHLSFALVEKSSGGGGLADLASSFGFSGLMGGSQNAFSGDNLLEILKSRHAIENTLLSPVQFDGKIQTLADVYIQVKDFRTAWAKDTKHPDMVKLNFRVGEDRKLFTRVQDSVLFSFYKQLVAPKQLAIARKDKKLSFVNVDFTSTNELFAKLFVEKLMENTYDFYKQTRTSQSRANIVMMEAKADSIHRLYESALYKGAGFSAVNINPAMQLAGVPRVKQENNAQLYATVYAEVLKNLETLKLDMMRETPIVQIIDAPILPLEMERLGKIKGIVIGGFIAGMLAILLLLMNGLIKNSLK